MKKKNEKNNKKTWNMKVLDNKTRVRSLLGNRDINKTHVNNLKKSMKKYGVLSAVTVMETGKSYTLLDGHHRWTAAKSLGFSVPAIVVKRESNVAVVELNNVQKNWSLADYANYYSHSNDADIKESYENIIQYHEETGMNYSALVKILGKQQPKNFKDGSFRVTRKLFANAFFVYLNDISAYVPFAKTNARFALGFCDIAASPAYEHRRMMSKLKMSHGKIIELKGNPGAYGKMMNEIYNYKCGQKNLIMFKNWRA